MSCERHNFLDTDDHVFCTVCGDPPNAEQLAAIVKRRAAHEPPADAVALLDELMNAASNQAVSGGEFFMSYAHRCQEIDRRAARTREARAAVLAALRPTQPPADDARDAARWRYLTSLTSEQWVALAEVADDEIDATVDRLMIERQLDDDADDAQRAIDKARES